MRTHRQLCRVGKTAALSLVIALASCGGTVSSDEALDTGQAEGEIIGGVDAKSSTLNAVGTLVEIYRYQICMDPISCGPGGSGGVRAVPVPVPPPASVTGSGSPHLDRVTPGWAAGGAAGAAPVGGAPAAAGRTGVGGTAGGSGGGIIEIVRYWPFCTGTLVGPTAVLSAKHCLIDIDYMGDLEIGFAVGPDASNPTAVYPIVDWDWESEIAADTYSLLSDMGSDVGVAHLGAPVVGVTPMAIGALQESDIGKRFTSLGYGIQNNRGDNGTRKAGSLTLRGIGGNYADYAFGGLEGFLKAAKTMPYFQGLDQAYLTQIYQWLTLLPDYQAFLGGKLGDAQPCYGDSGGPMVAVRDGVRTVFGNVTSGFGSSRLQCDFGAVYAVFGPATQVFLEQALQWVDPCVGITVQGYCDGDAAIRCTGRSEGKRRVTQTDCDLLGQTCGLDEAGNAVCVDPPEPSL